MLSGESLGYVGLIVAAVKCAAAGAVVEVVNLTDLWAEHVEIAVFSYDLSAFGDPNVIGIPHRVKLRVKIADQSVVEGVLIVTCFGVGVCCITAMDAV